MTALPPAKWTCPVPRFTGETGVRPYLRKFENAMLTNNWTKADRWLAMLAASLDGPAEKFYYSWLDQQKKLANQPNITYDMLALALQDAFKASSDKHILEEKCRSRKQQYNESAETYVWSFASLLEEYDDTLSEIEKIRYILRNSRPMYRKIVTIHEPKTIQDLLQLMRKVELTQTLMNDTDEVNVFEATGLQPASEAKITQGKIDTLTTLFMQSQIQTKKQDLTPTKEEPNPVRQMRQADYDRRNQTNLSRPNMNFYQNNPSRNNRQQNWPSSRNNFQQRRPPNSGNYFCQEHGYGAHSTDRCWLLNPRDRYFNQGNRGTSRPMWSRPRGRNNNNWRNQNSGQQRHYQQPQNRQWRSVPNNPPLDREIAPNTE